MDVCIFECTTVVTSDISIYWIIIQNEIKIKQAIDGILYIRYKIITEDLLTRNITCDEIRRYKGRKRIYNVKIFCWFSWKQYGSIQVKSKHQNKETKN